MQVAHSEDDKYSAAVVGTFAALTYEAAVKFKVHSVAGFSDDAHGYSYFLTIQPRDFDPSANPSSDTESKLIQVLQCTHSLPFVVSLLVARSLQTVVGHLADITTYAKFQDDIFRDYDFTLGRISHFPIDFCMGFKQ